MGDGFGLTLDRKQARTPGRNPLVVASPAVAQALAAEWQGQGERIDPATMPLTPSSIRPSTASRAKWSR